MKAKFWAALNLFGAALAYFLLMWGKGTAASPATIVIPQTGVELVVPSTAQDLIQPMRAFASASNVGASSSGPAGRLVTGSDTPMAYMTAQIFPAQLWDVNEIGMRIAENVAHVDLGPEFKVANAQLPIGPGMGEERPSIVDRSSVTKEFVAMDLRVDKTPRGLGGAASTARSTDMPYLVVSGGVGTGSSSSGRSKSNQPSPPPKNQPVPEPASIAVLGLGFAALARRFKRRPS